MIDLRPYLEDIEQRIDEQQEQAIYEAWKQFALGENKQVPFDPPHRTPKPSKLEWKHINVNDTLEDQDMMLLSQLENCHYALCGSGNQLMMMRANYGVGIISSLFGAKPFIMRYDMDTLPNVISLGEEGVQRLLDAPEPDLTLGYAERVFSMGERFAQLHKEYPKITQYVRIDHPDCQGSIDNAELLWGSDIFYAFYENPELVHALLRRITDTLKHFLDKWFAILPNTDGLVDFFGQMGKGTVVLREDSAMNLSAAFYREFIYPYESELLTHFGGGMVHFCGRGNHFVNILNQMPDIHSVHMSQPHLNDMEQILTALPDKGFCLFCPKGSFNTSGHDQSRIYTF